MNQKEDNENEINWDKVFDEEDRKPTPSQYEEYIKQLNKNIETMRRAADAVPKGTWIPQFFAIVYMLLSLVFLVSQIQSRYVGLLALFFVPLVALLGHYVWLLGKMLEIRRGNK